MSEIDENTTAFFRGLRHLMTQSGRNKDAQVINLITACIEGGANTRRRIVAIGCRLGYPAQHVVTQLNEGTGTHPSRSRWRLESDATYTLLQ